MEYDSGRQTQPKKPSRIPCCRTTCRAVVTTLVCCPVITIGLLLLIVVLWGVASGGDSPPVRLGPKATATLTFDTDDQAAIVAMMQNQTIVDALSGAFGDGIVAEFDSVSAAKQSGVITLSMFMRLVKFGKFDSDDIAQQMTDFIETYSTATAANYVFAISGWELGVDCIMDGLGADGFSAPLCRGALKTALDSNDAALLKEIKNVIEDGYTPVAIGLDSKFKVWAALNFNSALPGATDYTSGTSFNFQALQCDTFVMIQNNIEEVSKVIEKYFSACAIKTSGLKCKTRVDSRYSRDFSSSCLAPDVDGELTCTDCLCNSGTSASLLESNSVDDSGSNVCGL